MPKQGKGGRPKSGRITITVRLSPEEKELLNRAAATVGMDRSGYVRKALWVALGCGESKARDPEKMREAGKLGGRPKKKKAPKGNAKK